MYLKLMSHCPIVKNSAINRFVWVFVSCANFVITFLLQFLFNLSKLIPFIIFIHFLSCSCALYRFSSYSKIRINCRTQMWWLTILWNNGLFSHTVFHVPVFFAQYISLYMLVYQHFLLFARCVSQREFPIKRTGSIQWIDGIFMTTEPMHSLKSYELLEPTELVH